jgi:uncharacterized lipoprotein YajG
MKKILFLLLTVLFLIGCQGQDTGSDTPDVPSGQTQEPAPDTVVALVNGEPITLGEADRVASLIYSQSGELVNRTYAIDQVISKTLLLQEAADRGINATRNEVLLAMSAQLNQQGTSLEAMQNQFSEEEFAQIYEDYRDQIVLQELVQNSINISITEEQKREFYEQNKQAMVQNGQQLTYEQVNQSIQDFLFQRATQEALSVLAQTLKQQADISYE